MTHIPAHAINLLNCLAESEVIEVQRLKKLAFLGISDEIHGLRPVIWRILLNQWPADTSKWDEILRSQRETYEGWKDELISKPKLLREQAQAKAKFDHPLNRSSDSTWKQYYDDKLIWEEIEKDVKRTRVELTFFYTALDASRTA